MQWHGTSLCVLSIIPNPIVLAASAELIIQLSTFPLPVDD